MEKFHDFLQEELKDSELKAEYDALEGKAMIAFNEMRNIAAKNGYMTDEEINAEIEASRRERNQGKPLT